MFTDLVLAVLSMRNLTRCLCPMTVINRISRNGLLRTVLKANILWILKQVKNLNNSSIRFFVKHNGNKTDFCDQKFLSTTVLHRSVTVVLCCPTAHHITSLISSLLLWMPTIVLRHYTLKVRSQHCLHLTYRERHRGAQTTLRRFGFCLIRWWHSRKFLSSAIFPPPIDRLKAISWDTFLAAIVESRSCYNGPSSLNCSEQVE